ncbi:MAG TPA: methyltransferase [Gammaproteobacteria bacterium]|nr:methyltransferase [Gammaproteobacteria bacterium]
MKQAILVKHAMLVGHVLPVAHVPLVAHVPPIGHVPPVGHVRHVRHVRQAILAAAFALSISIAGAPAASAQTPSVPEYVAKAAADPARAEDRGIDDRRKAPELVAFSEAKPGDKVLELIPGSGYFTKVFSKVVGPEGRIYAVWPKEYDESTDKMKAVAAEYGNVDVLVQPAAKLEAPAPVDVVFTSQNYHDYPDKFMGPTDPAILNKAVFAALKPGGTYIVVDHTAAAGSGLRDTETLHRIDPATVKQQVLAAGFEFVGESDVLHNPTDDHTKNVFDPSIRGRTDQFAYKFRKPAR